MLVPLVIYVYQLTGKFANKVDVGLSKCGEVIISAYETHTNGFSVGYDHFYYRLNQQENLECSFTEFEKKYEFNIFYYRIRNELLLYRYLIENNKSQNVNNISVDDLSRNTEEAVAANGIHIRAAIQEIERLKNIEKNKVFFLRLFLIALVICIFKFFRRKDNFLKKYYGKI